MNIYVGSVSNGVTKADLRRAFEAFGQVASAAVMKNLVSGESRGFGFVEMPVTAEAHAAIKGMNGKRMKGRSLNVNEVRPRTEGRRRVVKGGGDRRL